MEREVEEVSKISLWSPYQSTRITEEVYSREKNVEEVKVKNFDFRTPEICL